MTDLRSLRARVTYVGADLEAGEEALPLFSARAVPEPADRPPQERRFIEFHRENPHVLSEVVRIGRALKATGLTEGAIDLVFEELRRIQPVPTAGDAFRLNNTYRAYYARLAMHRAPDLEGFFAVRRQRIPFDPRSVP